MMIGYLSYQDAHGFFYTHKLAEPGLVLMYG